MENIEKTKIYRSEREQVDPIFIQLKDDFGELKVVEDQEGTVTVDVENKNGKKINLNFLLPEGYRITGNLERERRNKEQGVFEEEGTYGDIRKKKIIISEKDATKEGWRYLLTVLHEIGHVVRAEQKPEEVNELLRLYNKQPEVFKDRKLLERIHVLTSNDERDSWAFAIRQLRKIAQDIKIPFDKIFSDKEAVRLFVEERLRTYKESALGQVPQIDLSSDEKTILLDEISKLYVREKTQ